MITIKDLEKIGIVRKKPEIYPERFFIPYVGEVDLLLTKDLIWNDIYKGIYNSGFKNGEREGERRKSEAIKKLLDID